MKFDWSEFTEADYDRAMKDIGSNDFVAENYYGNVRVGELCIDITSQYYDENELQYDVYVGGEDTGYVYSGREAMEKHGYETLRDVPENELYPYDLADGGTFDYAFYRLSYEAFKEIAEIDFTSFIRCDDKLYKKAKMPLHKW